MDKQGILIRIYIVLFFALTICGILLGNMLIMGAGLFCFVLLFIESRKISDDMINDSIEQFKDIMRVNNFSPDKVTKTDDLLNAIAINENDQKLVIINRNTLNENFSYHELNFKDIIETRIITNNQTVTSTSVGSQAIRGAVGGLAFGGIGAIVFGSGGKTTSNQEIKELKLEIVVNNILNPRHIVTFYDNPVSFDPSKEKYKKLIDDVDTWYRTLSVIIHRNKENTLEGVN